MTRAAHVPYVVERDEDAVFCAHARSRRCRPAEGALREAVIGPVLDRLDGDVRSQPSPLVLPAVLRIRHVLIVDLPSSLEL
jgi:hypothetical protein